MKVSVAVKSKQNLRNYFVENKKQTEITTTATNTKDFVPKLVKKRPETWPALI